MICKRHRVGGTVAAILIVEDEEQYESSRNSILADTGHKTLSASTADQAIALIEGGEEIDLVFTEIGLQTEFQAGFTFAQEAVRRRPRLPVLYTTGQGITDGMRALFVERYGFLAKPYTAEQLITALDNLLPKAVER